MEGGEDVGNRLDPLLAKDGVIACHLPVLVSQTNRITERVDLILALKHLWLHIGVILLPTSPGRSVIVGIGIAVDIDALELAQNHATQHFSQFLVFVGKGYVWPNLCARVTEPHGWNVTSIDEGIVITIAQHSVMNRALQRVGIAVQEVHLRDKSEILSKREQYRSLTYE